MFPLNIKGEGVGCSPWIIKGEGWARWLVV